MYKLFNINLAKFPPWIQRKVHMLHGLRIHFLLICTQVIMKSHLVYNNNKGHLLFHQFVDLKCSWKQDHFIHAKFHKILTGSFSLQLLSSLIHSLLSTMILWILSHLPPMITLKESHRSQLSSIIIKNGVWYIGGG